MQTARCMFGYTEFQKKTQIHLPHWQFYLPQAIRQWDMSGHDAFNFSQDQRVNAIRVHNFIKTIWWPDAKMYIIHYILSYAQRQLG